MHPDDPRWDEWVEVFTALAQELPQVPLTPAINGAQHYLCLLGENGLTPDECFAELAVIGSKKAHAKRVEVDASYYQDTVIFVP